jgi:hypothetical protein
MAAPPATPLGDVAWHLRQVLAACDRAVKTEQSAAAVKLAGDLKPALAPIERRVTAIAIQEASMSVEVVR